VPRTVRVCVEFQPGGWTDTRAAAADKLSSQSAFPIKEVAGSILAQPIHVTVAQPVERSLETRGVAGSTPAGHIITTAP
jgi:hypothetical protein